MAVNNQNPSAGQALPKPPSPNAKTPPSVLRLVTPKAGSGSSIHEAPASQEAKQSVYDVAKERQGIDAFTRDENITAEQRQQDLDKLAKENTKKTGYLQQLQNGQLFAKAEHSKDALLNQLIKESLPDDLKQAIKERTNGQNDPEAVFAKAKSNPVKVAESLKHIYPQQLQEMIEEAKEEGNTDEVARLQSVLSNMEAVFNIAEMENLGESQHMALIGHVAEVSEKGELTPEVSELLDKAHKSYQDLAENEDRITGVLTKINNDISETLGLGPKGDKHLRNKSAILIGAMMSDYQANGSIFSFNDDEAITNAVPFEPDQLNAPGLSAVTVRLLSKKIAPAWNRIYVGHLTAEQPYANIAMLDAPDNWVPNDTANA